MGYVSARNNFESAKTAANDEAIQQIADGLIQLSRAVQADLTKLEREISAIKSRMR